MWVNNYTNWHIWPLTQTDIHKHIFNEHYANRVDNVAVNTQTDNVIKRQCSGLLSSGPRWGCHRVNEIRYLGRIFTSRSLSVETTLKRWRRTEIRLFRTFRRWKVRAKDLPVLRCQREDQTPTGNTMCIVMLSRVLSRVMSRVLSRVLSRMHFLTVKRRVVAIHLVLFQVTVYAIPWSYTIMNISISCLWTGYV